MQSLRAAVDTAARDEFDDAGVGAGFGVAHFKIDPFHRGQFHFTGRGGGMPRREQIVDQAQCVGAVAGSHQRFRRGGMCAVGKPGMPWAAAISIGLAAVAGAGGVAGKAWHGIYKIFNKNKYLW
jgi:hypothetical protein